MLSGQVELFLGLGYFSSVRFVPYYVGMEAMLGFAQEGAEQLNAFYAVWESMGFLPEEFGEQQHFFFNCYHCYPPNLPGNISAYHLKITRSGCRAMRCQARFIRCVQSLSRVLIINTAPPVSFFGLLLLLTPCLTST